jgi:hypothetical protein
MIVFVVEIKKNVYAGMENFELFGKFSDIHVVAAQNTTSPLSKISRRLSKSHKYLPAFFYDARLIADKIQEKYVHRHQTHPQKREVINHYNCKEMKREKRMRMFSVFVSHRMTTL